ncbi:putative damage-inducible protein DinB [Myceligenerans xiligouense]|uniref:Putative damage-inducible protein DinB n=2 Tax=Myceligenerans xiligouense TaxID=253184 RepID=A0A3N4ZKM6_9MICO|nr:putative damage-inducible protein DinB [Myceligenerans xiligouense]
MISYRGDMPLSDVEPRVDSPDPAEHLVAYLDYYRGAVERKVRGLGPERLGERPLASGWSPLELLVHLVHMEKRWFLWGFLAQDVPDPWRDHTGGDPHGPWCVPEGDADVGDWLRRLHDGGARTREILSSHDLAERGATGGRFTPDETPPTLLWIGFHVLQEYARHAGHLDAAREQIDGMTGE